MKKLLLASALVAFGSVACDNSSSDPKPLASANTESLSSKLTDPRILSSKLEDGKGVSFEILDAEKFAPLTSNEKRLYMSGGEVYDSSVAYTGEKKAKIDAAGTCRIDTKAAGYVWALQHPATEKTTLVVEGLLKTANRKGSLVVIQFKQPEIAMTCILPVKPEEATWAHVQNNFGDLIRILDSDLK